MNDDANDQNPAPGYGSGPGYAPGQPPGPGYSPGQTPGHSPAPARQLVRDPYTRLGGVASGLASYFGVEVSLVRLGFVIATFFSGTGLIAYLIAWLVIPRAKVWPPVDGVPANQSVTGRELGIGLVILGLLFLVFINGGGTAQIVVPALLVAGGVWLLRQPEAGGQPSTGGSWTAPDPGTRSSDPIGWAAGETADVMIPAADIDVDSDDPFGSAFDHQPADTLVQPPPPPIPPPPIPVGRGPAPGSPVPPPKRRWGRIVIVLLVVFVLIPLLLIGLVVGLILGNGIDLSTGFSATYRPETVDDLSSIDHGAGELTIDLTELDLEGFDDPRLDVPIDVPVELGAGELRVIVPEGLEVDVDAHVGLGQVQIFGDTVEGIDTDLSHDGDDPSIALDLQVGAGEIRVEEG